MSSPADQREVFPVRLRANEEEAWFLWESTDAGDFFWSKDEGPLAADDLPSIMSKAGLSAVNVKVGGAVLL